MISQNLTPETQATHLQDLVLHRPRRTDASRARRVRAAVVFPGLGFRPDPGPNLAKALIYSGTILVIVMSNLPFSLSLVLYSLKDYLYTNGPKP